MNVVKKIIRTVLNVISVAVIVLAIFMLLTVLMTRGSGAPNFLGYSVFRVMTGSMEPELPVNTLIVVHRVEPEEVKVGDVISFYSTDPTLYGSINTHRVTQVTTDGGEPAFVTKGDANLIEDHYLTRGKDLIGVVVFSSFLLGTIVRLASNPLVFVPVIMVPLVVMLIINLTKTVRVTRQMAEEEFRQIREQKPEASDDPGPQEPNQ